MTTHFNNQSVNGRKIIIGITGASGSVYAVRLLEELTRRQFDLHGVFSVSGEKVMRFECDRGKADFPDVRWHEPDDMFSEIASGSSTADYMVVVPCSIHSLSCIAHGLSCNLLQRVAAVTIKENRRLILVPRETPLSALALENMLKLARVGVTILSASPGFYHRPQKLDDLVNHLVGKILDQIGVPHELVPPWF